MSTKVGSLRKAALLAVIGTGGFASVPAISATVTLPSGNSMEWTAQFLGSAGGNTPTAPTGNFGNDYLLAVPGKYSFNDSFSTIQLNVLTGTASTVGSYAFQDTYKFSINQEASGDALTVSLNLGTGALAQFDISNLQFRLYEVTSSAVQPGVGVPAGSTLITAWTGTPGQSTGAAIQASFAGIQAGTYFLDVAGTADGSLGGTYVGQLNLTPVPVPAALPLLLSGLGLLGGLRRRAVTTKTALSC
jgi:hypothetical protein